MYLHSKYLFSGNTGHAVWICCYFYPPEKIPWTRQYQVWVSISRVWQLSALSSPPLRWPLLTHAALPHQHQHQQSRTGGQGSNISHNNTVHSEAADQQ